MQPSHVCKEIYVGRIIFNTMTELKSSTIMKIPIIWLQSKLIIHNTILIICQGNLKLIMIEVGNILFVFYNKNAKVTRFICIHLKKVIFQEELRILKLMPTHNC